MEVSKKLVKRGNKVTVLTENYFDSLKKGENTENISVFRIKYPRIKFIGLLTIWLKIIKNCHLIRQADIIHIHDVFIWYLPLRFIFPKKRVFITFHGWEGKYPIPKTSIIQKRLAWKLTEGNICVGNYISKIYGIKSDIVTFGGVKDGGGVLKKANNSIVYVGRLEKDTGLEIFLAWLSKNPQFKVEFCGDGNLRDRCEKFGRVRGFCDPTFLMQRSEYCVPGGYLSAIEAMVYKCKILVFWSNPLKKDIWQDTPFYGWIKNNNTTSAYVWARRQTWDKLTEEYQSLWRI